MENNILSNVIEKIVNGENIEKLLEYCENDIYKNGPINTSTLEILSLIKELQSELFLAHEAKIIRLMGLFFKDNNSEITDLQQFIMEKYKESIMSIRENRKFTPMQNEIISKIKKSKNYSFSSPTSTGKSYIFKYLIENSKKDIMIIVPSRALINEFYIKVIEYVKDKKTMVMTFVDDVNKKHTDKHIFILTPERSRDVFKYKKEFDFEFILFDEAQLTNDKDERGMYYDGIVRRLKNSYPNANFIFAHPFIKNPDAQFKKNSFDLNESDYNSFSYKNTGQLFINHYKNQFYLFGTNKKILGETKVSLNYDPIENVLSKKGCILIYTAKARIIKKAIFNDFKKYIDKYCLKEPTNGMNEIIKNIRPYICHDDKVTSYFIEYLKRGIVFHHGSMPLEVRILLEKYINEGYCRICFATSTLAQGVNMPFDLVYIDKFENAKPLQLRNIIGRAGRSSSDSKFDYGLVVVKNQNMSDLRKIINYEEELSEISLLDESNLLSEHKEFRDAIKNNDFSDEYNLPNKVVKRAERDEMLELHINKLREYFENFDKKEKAKEIFEKINERLCKIFEIILLDSRGLNYVEKSILTEANRIMLYRYLGYSFAYICRIRYFKALKSNNPHYRHGYIPQFAYIPNTKKKYANNLFKDNEDVDYDTVVYDTYDYLDKLIDQKVGDVYYVALMKHYEKYKTYDTKNIAYKLKYGTNDEKHIMELRYGFSSEDFIWLDKIIEFIDENEIVFNDKFNELDENKMGKIKKYIF